MSVGNSLPMPASAHARPISDTVCMRHVSGRLPHSHSLPDPLGNALAAAAPCCCRLQWYIENNNTVTWPFDLAADQLKQRLSRPKVEAPFGPGELPQQADKDWGSLARRHVAHCAQQLAAVRQRLGSAAHK